MTWVQPEEVPFACWHLAHRYQRPEMYNDVDEMARVILPSAAGTPARRHGHSSPPFIDSEKQRMTREEKSVYLWRGVMPWMSVIRMTLSLRWDWQVNMSWRSSMDPCDAARWTGVERSSCWSSMEPPFCRQISTASMLPPRMIIHEEGKTTDGWPNALPGPTNDWRVEWSMIFSIADIQKMLCIVATWFRCEKKWSDTERKAQGLPISKRWLNTRLLLFKAATWIG